MYFYKSNVASDNISSACGFLIFTQQGDSCRNVLCFSQVLVTGAEGPCG